MRETCVCFPAQTLRQQLRFLLSVRLSPQMVVDQCSLLRCLGNAVSASQQDFLYKDRTEDHQGQGDKYPCRREPQPQNRRGPRIFSHRLSPLIYSQFANII